MPTPGYDPFLKLAQLFWGSEDLTELQLHSARLCAMDATRTNDPLEDRRFHEPELDQPPLGRFMKAQETVTGKSGISIQDCNLAHGLLMCIQRDDYSDPEHLPRLGIYDHFKGGVYLVTGHGSWASGNNEPTVRYFSMIFGTPHDKLQSEWVEVVQWPDGKYRSRYVFRGADLTVSEPAFKVPSPKR